MVVERHIQKFLWGCGEYFGNCLTFYRKKTLASSIETMCWKLKRIAKSDMYNILMRNGIWCVLEKAQRAKVLKKLFLFRNGYYKLRDSIDYFRALQIHKNHYLRNVQNRIGCLKIICYSLYKCRNFFIGR